MSEVFLVKDYNDIERNQDLDGRHKHGAFTRKQCTAPLFSIVNRF